jgi:Protein of unknown function with HXXEE motif
MFVFRERIHSMIEQTAAFSGRIERQFWLLALAQAAHSIEEMASGLYDFFWIATGRLHAMFPSFSQFRMAPTTFAVINMTIIAVLFGAVPFVAARHPAAIGLAWIAAVVEILNGSGHLAGTVVFSGYVPGALTAPFLLWTGVLVLRELARGEHS